MKTLITKNCFFFLVVLFPLVFILNTFYVHGQDVDPITSANAGGSAQIVGGYASPKQKLNALKSGKKSIISGFVKVSDSSIMYRLDKIPSDLQVVTVAFSGRPSSCFEISCGSPKLLFNYRNAFTKKDYLNDVKKLRNANKNRIFLFEISEQVLYRRDMTEAYDKLGEMTNFLKEYDFDGVNIRIDSRKWEQNKNELDKVVEFYNTYSRALKYQIGQDKVFAFTFTASGAFSNIGNGRFKKFFLDVYSPYSPDKLSKDRTKKIVVPYAKRDLAGIAIPIINHMQKDIDLVYIAEEYEVISRKDRQVFTHVISAYLHYAAKFGFGLQLTYYLNNVLHPIVLDDEDMLKSLTGQLTKDNKTRGQGNGIAFMDIGAAAAHYSESKYVPLIKKLLM